jgi:thioredoxin 1
MEVHVTDDSFEKDVLKAAQPVLLDFWAPWCGPCRMLGPIVEEISKEYAGRAVVGKLNTDENPNVASRFNISAIPTMLLFKNGQVVDQLVGLRSKMEIKSKLDGLLK